MNHAKKLSLVATLGLALACGIVATNTTHAADAPATRPSNTPATRPARNDSEALERSMEQMEKPFKALRKQISDPAKTAANLELIANLQRATLEAKRHLPPSVTRLPEADRKVKTAEYQQMMISLLRAELDVEDALLEGDHVKAAAALNSVHEFEEVGHKDFRPNEDDEDDDD